MALKPRLGTATSRATPSKAIRLKQATGGQLRLGQDLVHAPHPHARDAGAVQNLLPFGGAAGGEDGGERGAQFIDMVPPGGQGGEAGVVQQVGAADGFAQQFELAFGVGRQHDDAVGRRIGAGGGERR